MGFVVLRGLLQPELLDDLRQECLALIEAHGVERNFLMAQTADTPRKMVNVKQDAIRAHGNIIPAIYDSTIIKRLFEMITQERLLTCPYTAEEFIINALFKPTDTHGWHWDDYKYGVVFAVNVPEKNHGGFVQVVPNTVWKKQNLSVEQVMFDNLIHSFRLDPGDAYILRTDTGMHRVSPIQEGAERLVVNMVWSTESELNKEISHETMEALFA